MLEVFFVITLLLLTIVLVTKEHFNYIIPFLGYRGILPSLPYEAGVIQQQRQCRENCYTNYIYSDRDADRLMYCLNMCLLK